MTFRPFLKTIVTTGALLAAAGCSSNVETSGTGGTGHGTGGSGTTSHGTGGAGTGGAGAGGQGGTGGLPPCSVSTFDPTMIKLFTCNLPSPCPTAHYVAGGNGMGPSAFTDPTAPACVLQKLRDREIVQVQYSSDPPGVTGQYTFTETIFILDADHGASNAIQDDDLSVQETRNNRQLLQPASYFDACLAETDADKILACLKGWSAGCADVDVPCPVK